MLIADRDQATVVGLPFGVTNVKPRDVKFFSQSNAGLAIADHHRYIGHDLTLLHSLQHCPRGFGSVGRAQSQSWMAADNLWRPSTDRKLGPLSNLLYCGLQDIYRPGVEFHPSEHRKNRLLVMVEHLNLGDVCTKLGHAVHYRICQTTMIGPYGGNKTLHAWISSRKRFSFEI